jgi:hypothetical protein
MFELPESMDARVLVLAPNYQWFVTWCRMDNDPPLNPKDRRFVFLTEIAVRGRHKREGDALLYLGEPEGRELRHNWPLIVVPQGFTEGVTPDGRTFKI